jgi:hypothetical protein
MVFALAVLVAAGGVARTQPPIPTPAPSAQTIPPVTPPLPSPSVTVPTPPPPPTLDQLLDQLEQVQAQKAEMAKREESLRQIIRKKLDGQDQRLKKLGLAPQPAKVKVMEPDRVGRIIIEGFAAKDEKKVRELLGLQPGQILAYPSLEEARTKLLKAGFGDVTVEVVPPAGPDTDFKDIRVRVVESER